MRLDRLITLKLVRPFRRRSPGVSTFRLPILMYHGISDAPEPGIAPYYQTSTSPASFRRQLSLLAEQGFRALDLPQALEWLRPAESPRGNCLAITFDDGLRNVYTEAFPALREHGFTATVFLPTAFISDRRRAFKSAECLTWAEVREMRRHGIRFGSHTVNHPELVRLSWPEIERELRDSKTELERQLSEPATAFAYPFAFPQSDRRFGSRFRSLLAEIGYTCCATTMLGRARPGADPFRLKRLPVNSLDDTALFKAKLQGDYDWLALIQAAVKWAKHRAGRREHRNPPAPLARSAAGSLSP